MYARSTTIMARPESIDAGIAQVRDVVMPMLQDMAGCIGLSMLADRESGLCIATSAWESEDAMRASGGQLTPIRERVGEVLGGSPQVEEWEIAVLHRDHRAADGACVRAAWTQTAPDNIDRVIDAFKMRGLPAMEEFDGFCSASLFVDRATGRACSSVTFDSMAAMDRCRDAATELRNRVTAEAGTEVLDVGEFELVLAHLRVPELI